MLILRSKSTNFIYLLSVIVLLWGGPSLLYQYFGWQLSYFGSPFWQKIYPGFYFVFYCSILFYFKNSSFIAKQKKEEIKLIIACLLLSVYLVIVGQSSGFSIIPNAFIIPVLFSFYIPETAGTEQTLTRQLRKIILFFFLAECGLAIVERIFSLNLLAYYEEGNIQRTFSDLMTFGSNFRSTALWNHPLANALIVSTVSSFILFSNAIKPFFKLFLQLLGYVSLLCFNTRSSVLIVGFLLLCYVTHFVFGKKISFGKKFFILLFTIVSVYLILQLFLQGWGGRLLEQGNLQDDSVETRLILFRLFFQTDISQFLFGMSVTEMQQFTLVAGLGRIENYWIIFICRFGLIWVAVLFYLFVRLFKKRLTNYSSFAKFYIVASFILISSSNNSLASDVPGLAVFVLCSWAFNPVYKR